MGRNSCFLRNVIWVVVIGCFLAVVSCQMGRKNIEVSDGWSKNMRNMASSVGELLPFVYNKKEFENPKNKEDIHQLVVKLKQEANLLPKQKGTKMTSNDPVMKFSMVQLNEDLVSVEKALSSGQMSYARSQLKSTVNNCFNCHTKAGMGEKFPHWELKIKKLDIPIDEKAELYISSGNFKKARDVLHEDLKMELSSVYKSPYTKERLFKQLLIVLVRSENSPQKAIAEVDKFIKVSDVPDYLLRYVKTWRESLQIWSKSKPVELSYAGVMKRVHAIKKRTKKTNLILPIEASFVDHVQIVTQLQKVLKLNLNPTQLQNIYLLMGDSYAAIKDAGFWNFPEVYYEACVRVRPKTRLSKSCYKKYRSEIMMGFTGSAGVFLPMDEKRRLEVLKSIAGI